MDKFTKLETEKIIYSAAADCGYDVYEQNIQLRKSSAVISVKIDNGSTVSHDDCIRYTGKLKDYIEQAGITDNYTLEISSPGLKRKIKIHEFGRFSGLPVKIVLTGDKGGAVKGRIKSVTDSSVKLETEKGAIDVLYSDIKNSNLDC